MLFSLFLMLQFKHSAERLYLLFQLGTEMEKREVFTPQMIKQVQHNLTCLSPVSYQHLEIDSSEISGKSVLLFLGKILNELPVSTQKESYNIGDTTYFEAYINIKNPVILQFKLIHDEEGKLYLHEIGNLCNLFAHINAYYTHELKRKECS